MSQTFIYVDHAQINRTKINYKTCKGAGIKNFYGMSLYVARSKIHGILLEAKFMEATG